MNTKFVYVVMNDFIFDKQLDTEEEAEKYVEYCRRNYQGYWRYEIMTTKKFKEYLGFTEKIISDKTLSRAYGTLGTRNIH